MRPPGPLLSPPIWYRQAPGGRGISAQDSTIFVSAIVMPVAVTIVMPVAIPIIAIMMITIIIVSPVVFTPSTGLQHPAVRALAPFRARINITLTWLLPMPASPDMPAVTPVPEAGNPHVTIAWRRNGFISWRWRRPPDRDVNADLRHGLRGHKSAGADSDEYSCENNTFHGFHGFHLHHLFSEHRISGHSNSRGGDNSRRRQLVRRYIRIMLC